MHNRLRTYVVALAAAALSLIPASLSGQQDTVADRMAGPLGISMQRMGSGTTWIPDAVQLPSRHVVAGEWMLMLHGWLFGQYIHQGGPRGASQWGSLNWAMLMADRDLLGGRLQLRYMPSLDPLTVGRCGYPLLLQSGETCNGQPLVDRQHPHDFFMELGALYERAITDRLGLMVYAAPAGEPALGPVAFMHRPSAMDDPMAPLGHHWQDATHITYGVVTAGLFSRRARFEVSFFNGVEPDEHRWNLEEIHLNSTSARLTVNPTDSWSLSYGKGQLMLDPPDLPPGTALDSEWRDVFSAMHGSRFGAGGQTATTFIYGRSAHDNEDPTHSFLLENETVLGDRNTVFARAERVEKTAHALDLDQFPEEQVFRVASLSLGYIRDFVRDGGMTLGLGLRGTVNLVPNELGATYGSRTPLGGMIFLRLRPAFQRAEAGGMEQMRHH